MAEMVDRVVRAMCDDLDRRILNRRLFQPEDYLSMAQAAIRAMLKPTDAMARAGGGEDAANAWYAMINAALKD